MIKDIGYRERLLINKFKKEINGEIRRWLMKIEYPSTSIANNIKEL